jgi:GT2 family glycosyltransferase
MSMDVQNSCDIVIPVFNKPEITAACLESIVKYTHSPYRIILIDNGSDEKTKNFLTDFKASHDNTLLIRSEDNLGWVRAVNRGIELSKAPYVCIMNNDTVVETDDWLARLISIAETEPDIGLVNPEFGDEKKSSIPAQPSARPFIEIDFCRGYCIVIKRAVIDRIGGLDEAYGLGYYDDDDYSIRAIRAGFRCVRAGGVTVRHLRDSTFSAMFADERRRDLHQKNKELFYAKWGKRLRVVFILTKNADRKKVFDLLIGLARRQHIVYLWNMTAPLGIEHINIRERGGWALFPKTACAVLLGFNSMKKEAKRYNIVFVDDPRFGLRLSRNHSAIHYVDIGKGADNVYQIVDPMARAQ